MRFIESLVTQHGFEELSLDIYLLDDASTDGTAQEVKRLYPFVTILTGNGNLFWAGGMRKIWAYAVEQKAYDFFILFNDDVTLFQNALEKLIKSYESTSKNGVILIGSLLDPNTNTISYGGNRLVMHRLKHTESSFIAPDDNKLVPCQVGHANILLVDVATVKKLGIFSSLYTHYLADFDYTLTAYKAGISVLIAPGYYGFCENDHAITWLPPHSPLKERIKYLYHPKGLAYKEYLFFIKKHFSKAYAAALIKLWLKTLFPVIWDRYKKRGPTIEGSNLK